MPLELVCDGLMIIIWTRKLILLTSINANKVSSDSWFLVVSFVLMDVASFVREGVLNFFEKF